MMSLHNISALDVYVLLLKISFCKDIAHVIKHTRFNEHVCYFIIEDSSHPKKYLKE